MRLIGLTLCLLASSFGARAESMEDRVAALEARVKVLEQALKVHSEKFAPNAANVAGNYKAVVLNEILNLDLQDGKASLDEDGKKSTGTYAVADKVLTVTLDDKKPQIFLISGDRLISSGLGGNMEFIKTK